MKVLKISTNTTNMKTLLFLTLFLLLPSSIYAKTTVTTRITIRSPHVKVKASRQVKKDTPTGKSLASKQKGISQTATSFKKEARQVASGGYIEQRIREVFHEEPDRAVAIAFCESGMRTEATGYNTNGSVDQGAMQINSIHQGKYAGEDIYDLEVNLRVARQIYDAQGFNPWSCHFKV